MTNATTRYVALMQPTKTLHKHDCDKCTLKANLYSSDHTHHDVYVCGADPEGDELSVVIRHGSDGPDYSSFPVELARMVADQDAMWAAAMGALPVKLPR